MDVMHPRPDDKVLDVGVTEADWRSSNFLEARYPWPAQLTAVAPQAMPRFVHNHPDVSFVRADGRELPFADRTFDIGFSNAVIEHVGSRTDQRRFVSEMVRTCRRVFLCTPNARFPVDPHTLLPFVHWLPRGPRNRVLRLTGNARWATEEMLNPLSGRDLRNMFEPEVRVRLIGQRMFGLATVLIAVTGTRAPAEYDLAKGAGDP
jgi:ubiquinone/menaquinone biosynthesis C-methylase UbiE